MKDTDSEAGGAGLLAEADERRSRTIKYSLAVAVGAWVVAFIVYAALKSMQPGGTLLDLALLFWNAVIIAAPFTGYAVYRRMR